MKDNKILALERELMISILQGNIQNLDDNIKKKFSQELNKSDDWTRNKEFLQLFSSSMQIFSTERLNICMKKILSEYLETISEEPFEIQRRIASVCINYLGRTINSANTLFNDVIALLDKLSENPDLLMYKMLKLYFLNLRQNDQKHTHEILSLLKESGYSRFIENLPKNL